MSCLPQAFLSQTRLFGHKTWPGSEFLPLPLEERTEGSPQKKLLLPSGYKCASKEKERKEKRKSTNQRLKESKRKIEKERKENTERFFGLDNVWTICRIIKKRKATKKFVWNLREAWSSHLPSYQPNLCVRARSASNQREKKEQTRERPEHPKAKFPHQNHPS